MKIIDPDNLTYIVDGTPTTEILRFNTTTRRIRLVEGGAFTFKDGVTGQCLFSKIKEVIKASSLLISVPLPVREMIHDESMELIQDWQFEDTPTLKSIRDCGVAYVNTAGVITNMFACVYTIGEVAAGTNVADEIYFVQSNSLTATPQYFTHLHTAAPFGINELVEFYRDTNGDGTPDFDYSGYLKVFLRRAAYTYDEATNSEVGYPVLTYKKYNFAITHTPDAGVTVDDATLDGAGYSSLAIQWYNAAQSSGADMSGGPFNFHTLITGGSKLHPEIYSWVQRQLRKSGDIDADAGVVRNGKVVPALVFMDGDTLKTIYQATGDAYEGGVHIVSPSSASWNNIKERDDTNALRGYPLSVAVLAEFDAYLQGDPDSYFWIFKEVDYGTPGATPILDANSNQMKGAATGNTSFPFIHSVDVPVKGIALGKSGAKIAEASGTITTAGAKLVFVAGQERWYANPV